MCNTIVVFSSDHGEMMGSHSDTGKNVFELESLAIPFIIHWPKSLKSGINDILFGAPDVLPTLMGLAGLGDKIPRDVQGINFSSNIMENKTLKINKPEALLIMLSNSRGVMTSRYTLCLQENQKTGKGNEAKSIKNGYFYDNLTDPYQLNKVKLEEQPEVSNVLLSHLGELLKKANDPWFQERKYSYLIPYPSK